MSNGIERIYHRYELWEDWQHGMWREVAEVYEQSFIKQAACLLANPVLLNRAMSLVATYWKHSCEFNLTNTSRNRRAWLGQAACCFFFEVPEHLTRLAWYTLTEDQQIAANATADAVIADWEHKHLERMSYAKN